MASNFSDNATASGSNGTNPGEGSKPWTTWCGDVDPEMGDYVVVELKGEMSLRREPWDIIRAIVEGNGHLAGHQDVGN
ncbi:hypothetical protein Q7C36_019965 [Tachysurus vachellii]|uniref:Uncharacterized protein n=1 Tax=Tachysurus vachellii TaxID=175792 RepID=A0AA88RX18_TACVA|nr:hypothetical protein Q7C36_019965 [Tachysurus vachellii]